jgi:SAM-dependent methyltransferase
MCGAFTNTQDMRDTMAALNSRQAYETKFAEGYGLQYPDGHIIRTYERVLKWKLGITGAENGNLLDFGCGSGVHSAYLAGKGFVPHGVDVVDPAIQQCRERMPEHANHFITIEPYAPLTGLFDVKFDLILANQSLYYLPESVLETTLNELDAMLTNDGVVVFTMIGTTHYYYSHVTADLGDGLKEVSLKGRLNDTTYIRFFESQDEVVERLAQFEKISIGWYANHIDEEEGTGFHYLFIGRKKRS